MPAVESKFCQRGSLQNCEAGISRWQWRRSLRTNARLSGLALLLTVCVACSSSEPESTLKFVVEPLVNPNTASTSELQALPHLGEADIAAIVAARPYATPSELHNVLSAALTETELADIYMVLFLPVGLNNGAEADYQLIPSSLSARKLAHEFEEYRPYSSIEQFQKEMSKYVSDAEVQHLTRYVVLD